MSWQTHRGRVAALTRSRSADDPDLIAARLDLQAARLEDHVRRLVDDAPPLNDEQKARISALLAPLSLTGGDAA